VAKRHPDTGDRFVPVRCEECATRTELVERCGWYDVCLPRAARPACIHPWNIVRA
jgi:hypothetical protein